VDLLLVMWKSYCEVYSCSLSIWPSNEVGTNVYNLEPPPTSDTKWCKKYGGVFRRLWYIVPMVEFQTIQLSVNIPTQSKRTYTHHTYLHIISKHNGCFWPQWIYIFMLA